MLTERQKKGNVIKCSNIFVTYMFVSLKTNSRQCLKVLSKIWVSFVIQMGRIFLYQFLSTLNCSLSWSENNTHFMTCFCDMKEILLLYLPDQWHINLLPLY